MRLPQFVPVIFLSLIFSCSGEPDNNKKIVSQFTGILPQLMQNDSGLFHGIVLGMSMADVKKNITPQDSLGVEQPGYLQYEGKLATQKIYDYDCNFDEKGLKDMTIDIHLKDEKNSDALFRDFRNYFTKKYGNPIDTTSDFIWQINAGKRPAKLMLRQGDDYLYGELTFAFYDKAFDNFLKNGDTVPPLIP
ncbi:MAG: hypothetical protein HY064_10720 [Bacteroidetes bacterium]|nr:hypothetical protein [Bacteroidota bacterium]